MTIGVILVVNDGVVLGSDSMSTLWGGAQTYEYANKIFNLYRGLPIGAVVWGTGSVGNSSIETLSKDFRRGLEQDGRFRPASYTLEEVAHRYLVFLQSKAQEYYDESKATTIVKSIGFAVAGYSSDLTSPEVYFWQGEELKKLETRFLFQGDGADCLFRLVFGISPKLYQMVQKYLGEQLQEFLSEKVVQDELSWPSLLLPPPMPIMSTIQLAKFLCNTAAGISRFLPGATTVGGLIEIAAITKHEGFKWVRRKHYYDVKLNPQIPPIPNDKVGRVLNERD